MDIQLIRRDNMNQQLQIPAQIMLILVFFVFMFSALVILIKGLFRSIYLFLSFKILYFHCFLSLVVKIPFSLVFGIKYGIEIAHHQSTNNLEDNLYIFYIILLILTNYSNIIMLIEIEYYYYVIYEKARVHYQLNAKNKVRYVVWIIQVIFFLTFISLEIIFYERNAIFIGLGIINLAMVSSLLVLKFIASFKYSGDILEENYSNSNLKKIHIMTLMLMVSRLLEGIVQILNSKQIYYLDYVILFYNFVKNLSSLTITNLIIFSVLFLVLQFFIYMLPLYWIFKKEVVNGLAQLTKFKKSNSLKQSFISEEEIFLDDPIDNYVEIEKLMVKENGLGTVHKYKQKDGTRIFAVRKINSEISKYLLEQIQQEISKFPKQIQHVSFYRRLYHQSNHLYLYSNFYEGSIQRILSKHFSQEYRIQTALKIVLALEYLKHVKIYHGALSPGNIFLQSNHVKITDFGLITLKKYLSLTKGYSNKNIYSAPEVLKQKGSISMIANEKVDIYSFGIILYQLLTLNLSYRKLSAKQILQNMNSDHFRPKIPQSIPKELSLLIRKCWQTDSFKRPTYEQIRNVLSKFLQK